MDFLNQVIQGDCLDLIPKLPDKSIDLVITSPKYNVDLPGYDSGPDNMNHKTYIKWLRQVFKELYPKLKKGGRVAIVVGDGENGRVHTHSDIIQFMCHSLHYLHSTTIVWEKHNTSNRLSWGSFKSPQEPSFPTAMEYILVFAKGSHALQYNGETDLTREEFVEWSLTPWDLPRAAYKESSRLINSKIHPAPFPPEIPRRLIKMLSWVGATVLDPFIGSGTTAEECKRLGRNYIGFDISEKYVEYTKKRLAHIITEESLFSKDEKEFFDVGHIVETVQEWPDDKIIEVIKDLQEVLEK
jgi:DNA modification methylase